MTVGRPEPRAPLRNFLLLLRSQSRGPGAVAAALCHVVGGVGRKEQAVFSSGGTLLHAVLRVQMSHGPCRVLGPTEADGPRSR